MIINEGKLFFELVYTIQTFFFYWNTEFSAINNDWCLPIYSSTGSMFGSLKQYNTVPQMYSVLPYRKTKIVSFMINVKYYGINVTTIQYTN